MILADWDDNRTEYRPDRLQFEPIISVKTMQLVLTVASFCLGPSINVVGTVGNVINIVVFVNMGFRETITISLFGLAVSDLFCLLALQWITICVNPFFRDANIPFESYEVGFVTARWQRACFARVTGILTAYICFERCLCVTVPLRVKEILTPKRTWFIVGLIYAFMFCSVTPIFFAYDFVFKFYPHRNESLLGVNIRPGREDILKLTTALNNTYGYLTFGTVIVCTIVLVRKVKMSQKWRESATQQQASGPSASEKDRKVIVMVTTISSIFIVCFSPLTMLFIANMVEPEFSFMGKYKNLDNCMYPVSFVFEAVNSSVNIYIYYRMSTNYRSTFRRIFNMQRKTEQTT